MAPGQPRGHLLGAGGGGPRGLGGGLGRRDLRPGLLRALRAVPPPRDCILGTRFLVRHCILWKFREIAPVF